MTDLIVEVQDDSITMTQRGHGVRGHVSEALRQPPTRPDAQLTGVERDHPRCCFSELEPFQAAVAKARELGWIV